MVLWLGVYHLLSPTNSIGSSIDLPLFGSGKAEIFPPCYIVVVHVDVYVVAFVAAAAVVGAAKVRLWDWLWL